MDRITRPNSEESNSPLPQQQMAKDKRFFSQRGAKSKYMYLIQYTRIGKEARIEPSFSCISIVICTVLITPFDAILMKITHTCRLRQISEKLPCRRSPITKKGYEGKRDYNRGNYRRSSSSRDEVKVRRFPVGVHLSRKRGTREREMIIEAIIAGVLLVEMRSK